MDVRPLCSHACASPRSLDQHFLRAERHVRATFDLLWAAVEALGPVAVPPEKTRLAFHVRMSFLAVAPARAPGLARRPRRARPPSRLPRFRHVEVCSPRNVLYAFRLTSPAEVDDELRAWLAEEAYRVGEQRHLSPARQPASTPPTIRLPSSKGALAQLAEQRTFNPRVLGSIPRRPTLDGRADTAVDVVFRCFG